MHHKPWKNMAFALGRCLVAALMLQLTGMSWAQSATASVVATVKPNATTTTVTATAPPKGPHQVEPFDTATMAAWRSTVTRPTWVVFTATWCAVCPAVIAEMNQVARQHPRRPRVWAVVIDVAPGEDDARLLSHDYLRLSDRLLAFDGIPTAIRYTVDPAWRGSVPHVALMDKGSAPRLFSGKPPMADLMR